MPDINKVVDALKICLADGDCSKCPYYEECRKDNDILLKDTIKLISVVR